MQPFFLLLAVQAAAATEPHWRVAAFGERAIVYVDMASVERTGDQVRFRLHQRQRGEPSASDRAIRSVTADCATGNWRMVYSWPYRENGQNLRAEETLTTETRPNTVYGVTLAAACGQRFSSDDLPDIDRHAQAYFAATGSPSERLRAASTAH